ncbi:hypothetical protein U1Q18_015816 [Sarracenia purpurea var. burkii]
MESYQSRILFFAFSSLIIFNSADALWPAPLLRYMVTSDFSPSPTDSQPQEVAGPSPAPSPDSDSENFISIPPVSFPPLESISPSPASEPPSESESDDSLVASLMKVATLPKHINPAIEKICRTTDYPTVCISAITPYLNGKTDLVSVAGFAMQAANRYTKSAVSAAGKIITSSATPPQLKSAASDCKDFYGDALYNFDSAMNALRRLDVGTMNSMLSAAMTDVSDCDDELLGMQSPLLDFNSKLTKMASNCLAIVSLIHH